MKLILKDHSTYIIRIDRGEEIVETLKEFVEEKGIDSAICSMIGAVGELELWWYDTAKKEYDKKTFAEQLEIADVSGNIAEMQGEIIVHLHGTFGRKNFSVVAGHIHRAVVSGACEVELRELNGVIERKYDEETGLNLFI